MVSYAQDETELNKSDEGTKRDYYLSVRFPLNILNHYKLVENTKVVRTFRDDTKKNYTRELTYYFTLKMMSLPTEDFKDMDVIIDSMKYKFFENDKVIEANTQSNDFGSNFTQDMGYSTIPNALTFTLTFSPYGEIAKLTSSLIKEKKKFLIEQGRKMKDSLEKLYWLNQLSNENLIYITHLRKMFLPPGGISLDSVWKSPILLMVDRKPVFDTASVKIAKYDLGVFTVEADIDTLYKMQNYGLFYGIKMPVTIDSLSGKGKYLMTIAANGTIPKAETHLSAQIYARANKENFVDSVTVRSYYELLGRYKW